MNLAAKNAKSAKKAWPIVRLGDVCKFQRGLTYKKSDEVAQSDNIVLRSNNIDLEQGVLDLRELKCIREDLSVPDDKKVMPGSILMCMANGSKSHLGKVALVQDDLGYAFGGFMGLLVPEGIDSSYLYLALRSAPFKECIRKLQDGANINNLKFSDFCDFPIPLPPLPVQREIVARLEKELGEADALAAKFKGIAENADAEFKAELDETFKNVEGEKVRLGDVCEIKRGRVINKKYLEAHKGMYPVYSSQTLHDGIFGYIDTFDFEGEFLTWTTDGANAGSVFYHNGKFSITNVCGLLKIRDRGMDARWLLHYLTLNAKSYVNRSLGNPKLMSNVVANIPMVVPALTTQRTIVARLDTMRERCDKLKAAAVRGLRAAEDLRKAILAEAFEQ